MGDKGEGGVEKSQKIGDVIFGWLHAFAARWWWWWEFCSSFSGWWIWQIDLFLLSGHVLIFPWTLAMTIIPYSYVYTIQPPKSDKFVCWNSNDIYRKMTSKTYLYLPSMLHWESKQTNKQKTIFAFKKNPKWQKLYKRHKHW